MESGLAPKVRCRRTIRWTAALHAAEASPSIATNRRAPSLTPSPRETRASGLAPKPHDHESTIEKINRRRKKYGVNYSRCEPLQENGFDITTWSSDSAVWIRVQNKLFNTQESNRVSIHTSWMPVFKYYKPSSLSTKNIQQTKNWSSSFHNI